MENAWKDFGHTTPLQNAVFASTTLDYRFNSGKYTKFSRRNRGGGECFQNLGVEGPYGRQMSFYHV